MSPTLRHSLARSTSETSSGNGAIAYLRVVDTEAYADWESVYRDNVGRLYRLMYSRVGNRPDAEDLTSEVFRTALRPLQLGSSKGEVRAYLLTTAQTVLATHWRRHSRNFGDFDRPRGRCGLSGRALGLGPAEYGAEPGKPDIGCPS